MYTKLFMVIVLLFTLHASAQTGQVVTTIVKEAGKAVLTDIISHGIIDKLKDDNQSKSVNVIIINNYPPSPPPPSNTTIQTTSQEQPSQLWSRERLEAENRFVESLPFLY